MSADIHNPQNLFADEIHLDRATAWKAIRFLWPLPFIFLTAIFSPSEISPKVAFLTAFILICPWFFFTCRQRGFWPNMLLASAVFGLTAWWATETFPNHKTSARSGVMVALILWVIFIIMWNLLSRTARQRRADTRFLHSQLRKMFSRFDLLLVAVTEHLLGLLFTASLFCFTWSIAFVEPDNCLNVVVPLLQRSAVVLALAFGLIPFASVTSLSVTQFINDRPRHHNIFETTIAPPLFSGLIMGAIAMGFDSPVVWTVLSVSWVLVIVLSLIWHQRLKKATIKAATSDYRDRIIEYARHSHNVLDQVIPTSSRTTRATVTEEGITFSSLQYEESCSWAEIIQIGYNPSSTRFLRVVTEDGRFLAGHLAPSNKHQPFYSQLKDIQDAWSDAIRAGHTSTEFEYPPWQRKHDKEKAFKYTVLFGSTGLMLILGMLGLIVDHITGELAQEDRAAVIPVTLMALATVAITIFSAYRWKSRRLVRISTTDSHLTLTYDDNTNVTYETGQIIRLRIDPSEFVWIKFYDRTKLRHIDRVLNWPALRMWLLSHTGLPST